MSGGARSNLKPKAAQLVATGQRFDLIAKELNLNERTVRRWSREEGFQANVRLVQAEGVTRTATVICDSMERAAATVIALMDHNDPRIRLAAARHVLTIAPGMREQQIVEMRLAALEQVATKLAGEENG